MSIHGPVFEDCVSFLPSAKFGGTIFPVPLEACLGLLGHSGGLQPRAVLWWDLAITTDHCRAQVGHRDQVRSKGLGMSILFHTCNANKGIRWSQRHLWAASPGLACPLSLDSNCTWQTWPFNSPWSYPGGWQCRWERSKASEAQGRDRLCPPTSQSTGGRSRSSRQVACLPPYRK